MRIALIAHGALPIPPSDWGAVEGTIWHRKLHLERLGHVVHVYNTRHIHQVICAINRGHYDFVHCHNDLFFLACHAHLTQPYAVTSHFGGLYKFVPGSLEHYPEFNYLFEDSLRAPANIVLSEHIRAKYAGAGYSGFLRILRNAVETDLFRVSATGNGKAVCIGRVCTRKRQSWIAAVTRNRVLVDFVGPWDRARESFLDNETAKYVGVWSRRTLYESLTNYSCLVLLSDSEGAPKVVPEALAGGLSVVVNDACAANLTPEPFIAVLPNEESRPDIIVSAISNAIEMNACLRPAIRAYARDRFDYSRAVSDYLSIIAEFHALYSRA